MLVVPKPLDRMERQVHVIHKYVAILVLAIAIWDHTEKTLNLTIGGWSLCSLMTHLVVLNVHLMVCRVVFGFIALHLFLFLPSFCYRLLLGATLIEQHNMIWNHGALVI